MKPKWLVIAIICLGVNCKKSPTVAPSGSNGVGPGGGIGSGGPSGGSINSGGSNCFSIPGVTGTCSSFLSEENVFRGALSVNGKIFFAGGLWIGSYATPEVDMYDTATSTWTNPGILSAARGYIATSFAGNKAIFAGGNDRYNIMTYHDAADMLDLTTMKWTHARLSEARTSIATASVEDKAYFIGGIKQNGFSNKIDVYTAANDAWSQIELNEPRGSAAAAVINKRIYIAGGRNGSGNLRRVEIYEPTTGSWSFIQAPHDHPDATLVVLGSKFFLAGGDGFGSNAVDIYDTQSNSWTSAALSDGRRLVAAAAVKDKIIFMGNGGSSNIDIYDNSTGQWQQVWGSSVDGVAAASTGLLAAFGGFKFGGNTYSNEVAFFR